MDSTQEPAGTAEPKPLEPDSSVPGNVEPLEVEGKGGAATEQRAESGAAGELGERDRAREAEMESTEKESASSGDSSEGTGSGEESQGASQGSRVFGFVRARLPGVQLPKPGRALRHIAQENSRRRRRKLVRKRENQMESNAQLWGKEILCDFERHRWVSRGRLECTPTLRRLCMAGIPPSVRGRAWTALVGNRLEVTPELYSIFLTHALNLRAGRRAGFERHTDAARAAVGEQGAPAAAAGVATDGVVTGGDASPGEDAAAVEVGMRGTLGKEGSMRLIEADLPRTFPNLAFFHDGPMAKALREVLDAFVCFRPDVGYVQGMTFLAATLLLYMEDASAFQCLANLLTSRPFMDFYRLDAAKMAPHFITFMELFRYAIPDLAAHFEEEGVAPSLFFVEWTLTLFAKNAPLDAASRLWDGFLLDREWFLYRAALGILRMYQRQLLAMDMASIMRFLKRLPDNMDEWELMSHVEAVKVSRKRFEDAFNRAKSGSPGVY